MFSNMIRKVAIILLVSHYTHTFVLLTANIEDVKKLARKFVSAPLAQQIADFISRASGQQVVVNTNVSEENAENEEAVLDYASEHEVSLTDMLRQGPSSKRYKTLTRATTSRLPAKKPRLNLDMRNPAIVSIKELRKPIERPRQRRPKLQGQNPKQVYWSQAGGMNQVQQHQQLQQKIEELQYTTEPQAELIQDPKPKRKKPKPRPGSRPRKRPSQQTDLGLPNLQLDIINSKYTQGKMGKKVQVQRQGPEIQNEETAQDIYELVSSKPGASPAPVVKEIPSKQFQSNEERTLPLIMESDSILPQAADSIGPETTFTEDPTTGTTEEVKFLTVKRLRQRNRNRFSLSEKTDNRTTVPPSSNIPTMIIDLTSRYNGFNIATRSTDGSTKDETAEEYETTTVDNSLVTTTETDTIILEHPQVPWWEKVLSKALNNTHSATTKSNNGTAVTFTILGRK